MQESEKCSMELKKKMGWERDVCISKGLAYTRHTAAVVEI